MRATGYDEWLYTKSAEAARAMLHCIWPMRWTQRRRFATCDCRATGFLRIAVACERRGGSNHTIDSVTGYHGDGRSSRPEGDLIGINRQDALSRRIADTCSNTLPASCWCISCGVSAFFLNGELFCCRLCLPPILGQSGSHGFRVIECNGSAVRGCVFSIMRELSCDRTWQRRSLE